MKMTIFMSKFGHFKDVFEVNIPNDKKHRFFLKHFEDCAFWICWELKFEGSSWKIGHWGKKQLFPEWTFFFDFWYNWWSYQMIAFVLRIWKSIFFSQIILLEKAFDKMTMSRSSICNFFSEEIPPTSRAWKKNERSKQDKS